MMTNTEVNGESRRVTDERRSETAKEHAHVTASIVAVAATGRITGENLREWLQ
jgi:hypothetical protein